MLLINEDRWGFTNLSSCGPSKCWRLLLCCFCWLNWTANQSCFSPLPLFFHFATEGGRCLKCSAKRHVCCRLQSRNGAKQGGMRAARDSKPSTLISSPILVAIHYPLTVCCSYSLSFSWHFLYMPFDYKIVCNWGQTISICVETFTFAKQNHHVILQLLEALAP